MALIKSQARLVLDGQPSCIQFVPNRPEYALIGTYELKDDESTADKENEAKEQSRTGKLILIRVTASTL